MKNRHTILCMLAIFILIIWGCKKEDNRRVRNDDRYYYGSGEKIYLNSLNNKLAVKYKDKVSADKSASDIASVAPGSEFLWYNEQTAVITLNPGDVNKVMTLVTKDKNALTTNPVYILASEPHTEMVFTDEILVKFKPTASSAEIKKINNLYGTQVTKETDIYTLLTVPRLTDALEIANKYQESGLVTYSHPDFYAKISFGSTYTPSAFLSLWK